LHEKAYEEMYSYFEKNKNKIQTQNFVHGNLDASTVISNSNDFKFINFENSFIGSYYFDLANLVFELQMSGIKEFDFITKKIKLYELTDNRFKAGKFVEEYKICKYIWTRKKFLDIICEYVKEVIVLNKTRKDKMFKLANNFANHFYRFDDIASFKENKNLIVSKFSELILS
jgi:5-methylthioribose kinase